MYNTQSACTHTHAYTHTHMPRAKDRHEYIALPSVTDIPKCCDASKPSMTDSESCELIIGKAYPIKKEPVDEESSVVYDDVDVGSDDDDDDDDDKSVMLEDLEQSHAIHYNRGMLMLKLNPS